MISVFKNQEDCCGCTACKYICPTQAIEMVPDDEGFLYPIIDQKMCIDCRRCIEVCAFQKGYDTKQNFEKPEIFATKHKDDNVRGSSTSGGVFTAISDRILESNGVVFGVAYDENMNVIHRLAKTKVERDAFKGSKYVQSDLRKVFVEIRELLSSNAHVLFTGTPCQTAGLRSFLGNGNSENLYLCDIVCHGTPSPLMWREHVNQLEQKEKSKIVEYYCRDKIKGWHAHNEMIIFKNRKKDYESVWSQKHKKLFYSHNILRPSCHNCKYTNFCRPSDVTIADFWGIDKAMPEFDDNKGVSLVLVNTLKGEKLFESAKSHLFSVESNTKDCFQPQLLEPTKPARNRDEFWRDYKTRGYDYVIRKYAGCDFISRVKNRLRRIFL